MTPVRIGKPQTPYLIRGLEASFDILFALVLGKGTDLLLETVKHEPQSVIIVNKLSGKALEVENSSVHRGARIQQVTLRKAGVLGRRAKLDSLPNAPATMASFTRRSCLPAFLPVPTGVTSAPE
jgi:hypothetical protein